MTKARTGLGAQVADALRVIERWSPARRASVRLEGGATPPPEAYRPTLRCSLDADVCHCKTYEDASKCNYTDAILGVSAAQEGATR